MNFIRKYGWIAMISGRSNLAYIGEVTSRLVFMGLILFILMRLWQVTYGESRALCLGGLTLAQMIWYLTITESISLSGPLVWKAVDEDVRTGSLAGQLTKPIAYPLYRFAVTMGERIMRLGMNFAAGVVIATTLVGWVPLSTQGVLLFAIALPMALILDFLANFIVGLGAFWLEDTSGLALIYSRTSWILGGMLIPIDLFPSWLRSIVQVLPFSSMYYGPARLFVDPSMAKLIDVILRQTVACAVFYVCVALIYRAALRRVFANGG